MKPEGEKRITRKKKGLVGFDVSENECIWMKAGVVSFRLCDNAYDCNRCPFDKGMRKALSSEGKESDRKAGWAQRLRESRRGDPLPCRHALTGRSVPAKICPHNYECYHCPYDQWLDDYDQMEYKPMPGQTLASGYRLAKGYYYHPGHSWARFEHGGRIRVGCDDFMLKLFGPLDRIELPGLGAGLNQNQTGWTLYRDGRQAPVRSPVSGTVLTVNNPIQDHPDIAHRDPYDEGWLFIVEPDRAKQRIKKLHFGSDSVQWMEKESKKLLELIGPEDRQLPATGGEPIDDVVGSIPQLEWDLLVETFLNK